MKRMFAVVRRPVICLLAIMGGAALTPTVCPAQGFCSSFPLPRGLEVGDRWTYLERESSSFTDTTKTVTMSTITITVDARHELSGQTYFELSDGGLYRVDDERRTWQYDADTESEVLCWDLWVEPVPIPDEIPEDAIETWLEENEYGWYISNDEEFALTKPLVVKGEPISGPWAFIKRNGPFRIDDFARKLAEAGLPALGWDENTWRKELMDRGATEVYQFDFQISEYNPYLVIAPEVGVLCYAYGSWDYLVSYTLIADEQHVTVVEDISLGRLKRVHAESASKKSRAK